MVAIPEIPPPTENGTIHKQVSSSVPNASNDTKNANHHPRRFLQLLLDGLLLVAATVFCGMHLLQYTTDVYYVPQLHLMLFNDHQREGSLTYYHRYCDETAQSAFDTVDLIVTNTTPDALDRFLTHGMAILPKLLSEQTAHKLRQYILQQNERIGKQIYVIENDHRWSFPIQVDQDPIIGEALTELLSHEHLIQLLQALAGPDPAVIEFTAITAEYGAKQQFWHQDVTSEGNSMKYGRNFVPSYSLFVPLQNTTAGMGATGICPGTHMCPEGTDDFCPQNAFQASGSANNWEMGAGALVSQQTTHRGEAFTDPNGTKRVVFILTFAPRPRTGPNTLETRMIGVSGSYSLHWSQWGHTLSDFQNPSKYMRQPWRTLRSLGLYKPKNRKWGWDYITSTSGRIIHSEYGYGVNEFEEFMEKGAFRWLPKPLHGQVQYDPDEADGTVWLEFFKDTIKKCLEASQLLYGGVVVFYIICSLLLALLFRHCQPGGSAVSKIGANFLRFGLIHAVVLGTAWYILQSVEMSSWAMNIRREASFYVDRERALSPTLPAVLPIEDDIFILEGMQSEYLYSNTIVLDYTHPGNAYWKDLVNHYGPGYDALASNLQQSVCKKLITDVYNDSRRILIQNHLSNWAQVSDSYSLWYCHRCLSARSNYFKNAAIKVTDHLLSESRFGYWRESKMHKFHAAKFAIDLQDRVLDASRFRRTLSLPNSTECNSLRTKSFLPTLPTHNLDVRERNLLPIEPVRAEPWTGAWMKEGDIVEAMFDDDPNEWYRGKIVRASSNRMVWDVRYDDGDFGHGVCLDCVRPYVPYQNNETIEMRVNEDYFAPVKVLSLNEDDTVDVLLIGTTRVYRNVKSFDLRRITGTSYAPIPVTVDIQINSMHIPGYERTLKND